MSESKIITAALLVDQIRSFINVKEPGRTEQIDPREIRVRLDQLANDLARLGLFENMRQGDKQVSPHYVTTFRNVPVKHDPDMNLDYCELPARYLALPHDKGIDTVAPMGKLSEAYIPVRRGSLSQLKGTPAGKLAGKVGYWPEDLTRIYFTRRISETKMYLRLLIADSSAIADTAPYPIDPGKEAELIERTAAWFLAQKAEAAATE